MKRRKPRNFERRKKTPRQLLSRKTLLAFFVMAAGLSVVAGTVWVVFHQSFRHSVFFKIDQVDIEGCDYINPKKVLALTGLDVKSSLWEIDSAELAARLEKQDWIERVRIDKDWPSRVRIIITERNPKALISRKGKLYYIDGKGVVFAPVLPANDIDFPIITLDANIKEKTAVEKGYVASALSFLHRASEGNPDLPKQNISEIHFAEMGLIMFLVDYPFPIYLGEKDMYQKYRKLSKVLSWLYNRQKIGETEYIDMNYITVDKEDSRQRGEDVMVVFKKS